MPTQLMFVPTTCPTCGATATITVPVDGYTAWRNGQLIQHALPTLSPSDRESLITGYCHPCFDALFADEPDEMCFACSKSVPQEDTVWAEDGNPYHVGCCPNQPNYDQPTGQDFNYSFDDDEEA